VQNIPVSYNSQCNDFAGKSDSHSWRSCTVLPGYEGLSSGSCSLHVKAAWHYLTDPLTQHKFVQETYSSIIIVYTVSSHVVQTGQRCILSKRLCFMLICIVLCDLYLLIWNLLWVINPVPYHTTRHDLGTAPSTLILTSLLKISILPSYLILRSV
jgi:hypothetical protein